MDKGLCRESRHCGVRFKFDLVKFELRPGEG